MGASKAKVHFHRSVSSHLNIILLLAFGATTGLLLGNDYGPSLDEVRNAQVGEDALRAYTGSPDYFSHPSLSDHGPVYFMLFSATSRLAQIIAPNWSLADGRHLSNFAVFLVGIFYFYQLCLHFMSSRSAWMAAALFATQPLLFGHGFVNQKDIPFLTFLMATIVTGVKAGDQWIGQAASPARELTSRPARAHSLRATPEWRALSPFRRVLLLSALGLALLLLADLFFIGMTHHLGESTILAAYDGRAPSLMQQAFSRVATDAYKTSVDAYLAKYETLFALLRLYLTVCLVVGSLLGASLAFRSSRTGLGTWRALSRPSFLASAALLGVTISIRQVGVFAGAIVGLYMLYRGRTKAMPSILVYSAIAALMTYATWPYLWPDPVGRFTGSIFHAANFPIHPTLFKGSFVRSDQLPWDYFPTLAGLQLTEPAVLLVLLGFGTTAWRLAKGRIEPSPIAVLGLWVGLPVSALISRAIPAYGIRHLLFVFPPLFVLAGVGLELVVQSVRRTWIQALVFGAMLLPGIIGIVQLHPYEPIYFNSLAGGVSGAYGEYTLDRWCLSYREAAKVVNGMAEPGDTVGVNTELYTVVPDYLRPDLKLLPTTERVESAKFVINCVSPTRADWQTEGFELVYTVHRGTAVLAEVWQKDGRDGR